MATKKNNNKMVYSEPSNYFSKEDWDKINGKTKTTKKPTVTKKKTDTTKKKK